MYQTPPKITVLMPVFNGQPFLAEAIESILKQSFTDFEFLIIDDGSTDDSLKIIQSYKDPRIRLVLNKTNLKLVATLNAGFELANGEYLARMDCDDISLPERLQKQVAYMDAHPEVGICGTWAKKINGLGLIGGEFRPLSGQRLMQCIWFPPPLIHPTVMLRKEIYKSYNFDPDFKHAEDYELWCRVSKLIQLNNIPEYLLLYREHPQQVSLINREKQLKNSYRAFIKHFPFKKKISYEDFLALILYEATINPIKWFYKAWLLTAHFSFKFCDFIYYNLRYFKLWLKHK